MSVTCCPPWTRPVLMMPRGAFSAVYDRAGAAGSSAVDPARRRERSNWFNRPSSSGAGCIPRRAARRVPLPRRGCPAPARRSGRAAGGRCRSPRAPRLAAYEGAAHVLVVFSHGSSGSGPGGPNGRRRFPWRFENSVTPDRSPLRQCRKDMSAVTFRTFDLSGAVACPGVRGERLCAANKVRNVMGNPGWKRGGVPLR